MNDIHIAKYLAGEASPLEAQALEDWLSQSPMNRQQFEQYRLAWAAANHSTGHQLPDISQEWQRLSDTLHPVKQKASRKMRRLIFSYGVAASVLLVLAAGIYFFMANGKNAPGKQLVFTSPDTTRQLHLPDSSAILLSANSRLTTPENFDSHERRVQLAGEVWFEVTHRPDQPFLIHIDPLTIKVLGTSFTVRENKEAGTIELFVQTGKVSMSDDSSTLILTAGQWGIYHIQQRTFVLQPSFDPNELSWVTKRFNFQDLPLDTIARYLEKAYSTKIRFNNPALSKCRMTSEFDNKSIEYILAVIAATLKISYNIQNNVIYFSGEGCN